MGKVRRTPLLICILLLLTGAIALSLWWFATNWRPSPDAYRFQGLDVGATQGPIEWPIVHGGGADFAYLTATLGTQGRDPSFEAHWGAVFAAGMRRGAVHIYSLCQPAEDQANNFNTTVPRSEDALPAAVALDFQPNCAARPGRGILLRELAKFLSIIEVHTGKPTLLKVTRAFDSSYRLSETLPRPIWSTQNFFPPDYSAKPWRMWQASDMRRIDGVAAPVHWDVVAQ